ncbi:MAG: DUF5618 family protein [Bacteroidales bacterium]|nr:DUF5618 family protein [Bacteroidales bacterium]
MEKKNPIEEARRYVENARELLNDKGELDYDTQTYMDRKYVKMAGNTLWNGVLLILNATFRISKSKGRRLSMDDYRRIVGQRDLKLLTLVNRGYDTLHLSMGYDGNQDKDICMKGLRIAGDIIDRCESMIS